MNYSIGVDIGGSHITSAVIDLDKRLIIRETVVERPVDNKAEADEIIGVWSEAIRESLKPVSSEELSGIGFAMPGPFDYVNGICLIKGVPKYEKLYGTDIGKAIRAELRLPDSAEVRFINDASAFAVGEAWAGKGAGYRKLMAITLGTGFGSAFSATGSRWCRATAYPTWGVYHHIKYHNGIADDYFSTRWFISRYSDVTGEEAAGVYNIAKAAGTKKEVRDLFDEFGSNLGEFLAPWLNRFGAESLVIGGNISRAYDLFGEAFRRQLSLSGCSTVPFVSELLEDSALLGSGYLLDDSYWKGVKDTLKYM
ncbi:MAG: ROK family protein [Bacteroidales bacterium]